MEMKNELFWNYLILEVIALFWEIMSADHPLIYCMTP